MELIQQYKTDDLQAVYNELEESKKKSVSEIKKLINYAMNFYKQNWNISRRWWRYQNDTINLQNLNDFSNK